MKKVKTFDLCDLTEEFWEKVVFFEIWHSSGLGGPGSLWMVTEDCKEYFIGFESLPFGEKQLGEKLHPMFLETDEWDDGHYRFAIENNGWKYIKGTTALIRDDIYESFLEIALEKKLVKENGRIECYFMEDIVGLALGAETLDRFDYIKTVEWQEKMNQIRLSLEEEHEKTKFLPEHFNWKPLHVNNIKSNPVFAEYSIIVNQAEDKLTAQKFTIVFQRYMSKPMMIDPSKGIECYVLFEKYYYDFYGFLDYSSMENKRENRAFNYQTSLHEFSYFKWNCLYDEEIYDYGNFVRCFRTLDEAKEYAMSFANANSHRIGNRETMVTELSTLEEHKKRVERYEAYQAFYKYHKEILDVIANFDDYPDKSSGGGGYLISAVLKKIPQITKKQLMYFWHDVPLVLEKRTQDMIEMERQKSMTTNM